jgi:hypothetical protein
VPLKISVTKLRDFIHLQLEPGYRDGIGLEDGIEG